MTFRRIVLPIDIEGTAGAAIAAAVTIARDFGARLDALYARGESIETARFRYPTLGEAFFVQVEEASRDLGEQREAAARDRLEAAIAALAADTAAPEIGWIAADFEPAEALLVQGGIYDLLVLDDTARIDHELVENALYRTGRPTLIVPGDAPAAIGERIMIGWNRSPEAAHAVAAALPLLARARKVTIASVRTTARKGPTPDQLAAFLGDHGIEATIEAPDPKGRPTGEVLLELAGATDADLLVAGASYGSRLREVMPGGVTGHLLRHTGLPLFLAH